MDNNVAIKVDHVSKDFVLPHEKVTSIKSAFTGMLRRNHTSELQHALRNISFEIKKGEFFGIVGRNGSGKSTMLKILANIYQPTKGSVITDGKLVPFIELGVGFNPELTGRENVYLNGAMLGFSRKEIDDMYADIVEFAELGRFMDQKLKNYSSGMQVRLAFAMATRSEADILLVDEVLAVGDADFQRKCFDYFRELKRKKKTVVFVSHDMNAIREYCDRVVLLEDSNLRKIGHAEEISQEYAKLFMADTKDEDAELGGNRWGNGAVRYTDVEVRKQGEELIIVADVLASRNIETTLYGLHIFSPTGLELTATNNRLLHFPDLKDLKRGDRIRLTWNVLNVFNDGRYSITLTLAGSNGTEFDWYNDAATFRIKRPDRSTTSILPPITTSAEKLNNNE